MMSKINIKPFFRFSQVRIVDQSGKVQAV